MLFVTPNQQCQSTGGKVWYLHNSSTARRTQEPDLHNILRQSYDYPTIPAMPKWLGSRAVSVLDLGAERPGFKSQPRRCRGLRQTVHTHRASVYQAAKLVAAPLRVAWVTVPWAWRKEMAAYRRVYDSRHLQADCQEPGSAPEPYAR